MEISEAKQIFKEKYESRWLELADEHERELFFKQRVGPLIRVSEEELEQYASFEDRRGEYSEKPTECAICSKNYMEQMVSFSNRLRGPFSSLRNSAFVLGDQASGEVYVEVGEASQEFKNYFRFNEAFHEITLDRVRMRSRHYRSDYSPEMFDMLYSPITIKVFNIGASSVDQAVGKCHSIVDGCLFNLAYLKDVTLKVDEEWPRRQLRNRPFQFQQAYGGNELPLPRGKLNADITKFYQRAMSTDDPVNEFLSYYQVMEYFFLIVSDEQLYQKLTRRITDPRFSVKPTHLDKLIQDTLEHKRESDETEMLKGVLQKYIDEDELSDFIKSYEDHLGEKAFTKKQRLFGEENEVRLNPGHTIGNVARRIKLIRNALVHSSDRHKRQESFVPTPAAEAIVRREVPLVKYLAERVIIASTSN